MRKRLFSLALAMTMIFNCLIGNVIVVNAAEREKPTKVVVSVEGLTLGQGFYVEPTIVTFDEFINYWTNKGQTVSYENITAGGVLSYVLQKNGTPMDNNESPGGPGYLAVVKGIDKGYTQLPQFLADAGVTLEPYDGDKDLGQYKYSSASGWLYTEGNIMSNEAMGSHRLYTYGVPYTQNGESYYVVRLQYTVDGLGADLGYEFVAGSYPYAYKAADKGQLYILYANLSQTGFFESFPETKEQVSTVMNKLNATQDEVDAAYDALLTASKAEKPVFSTDLSEEKVHYGLDTKAEPLQVEASVSSGNLSYEWFVSTDKVNWASLGEAGAANKSYTPDTDKSGTKYYKCVVTNYDENTGLSNTAESKIATVVTGVSTPVFEQDLDETEISYLTVDIANALEINAKVDDSGTLTYQWYESDDKASWNPIQGETSERYTPGVNTVGTKYYKCTVTNTYEAEQSSVDSKIATVTVRVDIPNLTKNLMTTTYYPKFDEEQILSVEASVKDSGELTYQWYSSPTYVSDGSVDGMTAIEGATSASYRLDTSKPYASYYKVKVTNTLQGQSVSTVSNWSRVEVRVEEPKFTENLKEKEKYYLIGEENPESLEVNASVSDGGIITYQWYKSEEKPWHIGDMTPIEGVTAPVFTPDVSKGHTTYYACQATNTNRGDTKTADSEIIKVVVSCEKPTIIKDLEDKEYRAGDTPEPLTIEASVTDGGTLSYQWYYYEGQWEPWSFDEMTPIEGANEAAYTPELNKKKVYYACRVTNTKDGNSLSTESKIITTTVSSEAPVFIRDLTGEIFTYEQDTEGDTLSVEASVSDGGQLSYQWYSSNGVIEGATEKTFTLPTDIPGQTEYWVTVTNTKLGITNSSDSKHVKVSVRAKQKEISTEEDLRGMQKHGNYILTSDIRLTENWEPIDEFEGVLDGNGYTISNLVIEKAQRNQLGFFNKAGNGAVIKNLGLIGSVTDTAQGNTGALVGVTSGDGLTISNCYVNADVSGDEWYNVGGLIGNVNHSVVIENCYFTGTLTGGTSQYSGSGGLVGALPWSGGDVKIINSYTTSEKAVGNYNGSTAGIENVYCNSDVNAPAKKIPESMEDFLAALNLDGSSDAYVADTDNINNGYPILSWQLGTEEPGKPEEPDITIKEYLDKVETYLQTNVTDPIVDTLGGEWSVLAMARYGMLTESTKTNYLANLYHTLDEKEGVLDKRKYTEYSRVVLALTAIGVDPSDVNGYNMLLPLAEYENVKWQGINGPIWALIALDSHDYDVPQLTEGKENLTQTTKEKLIEDILNSQLIDYGWALSGNKADPDMTAMAIQALAPYYGYDIEVTNAVDAALETLSGLQTDNGGFASYGAENMESAAQVVIALSALDVNLLEDERFVKNGNSVLDYLLTYQLSNGAFKHTPDADKADAMSTDQGALALLAYYRAMNGQTNLFDMSDVKFDSGNKEETPENVKAFREKMNTLPSISDIRIKDRQAVYALMTELAGMGTFEEKEAFRAELQKKLDEVELQKKVVEQLDQDIWDKIDPLSVTKEDAKVVKSLMERYKNIPEENREYVKYREDLLNANEIIEKLLKAEETPTPPVEEKPVSGTGNDTTNNTTKKPSNTVKNPAHTNSAKEEKSIVKAEVKNNIVAKSEVEKVKGTEKNLQMTGEMSDGTEYIFTLNGKDIKTVKDVNIGLSKQSKYEDEIRQLAEHPFILEFAQKGSFPGAMLVEVAVDLEDGEYLLLYYNAEEQKAEYVQKVEVKDKKTKFLVEKGGAYFIDKKASAKSLKDQTEEEKVMDVVHDELVLQGEKGKALNQRIYVVLGICAVLAVSGGIAYVVIRKKRQEKE